MAPKQLNSIKRQRIQKKPFDVVLLDLTIPGGTGGKETIRKLLEIDPHIKAIVSSGYSNDPIMSRYKEFGFKNVILKPYTISELSKALQDVLKKTSENLLINYLSCMHPLWIQ